MTFLTGNCRWLTSQPNRTWSGLSNSQRSSDRARHRRLSRAPAGPGGLSSLRRQGAESSRQRNSSAGGFRRVCRPKPSRNANFSVTPGRAAHPPRGWGLLSPTGAVGPQHPRGESGGMGWVLGGGPRRSPSRLRNQAHVPRAKSPSFRPGTDAGGLGEAHGPGWCDVCVHPTAPSFSRGKRPTSRCCGCCRLLTRGVPLSSSVLMADVALGPTAGLRLISSPRGRVQLGGVSAREPWFSRRLETVGGAGRHVPHSTSILCVDVHGCPDHEMPTHAYLPLTPFKSHFQSILRIRKQGFPGGSEGKASACSAGGLGSIPGSGRCPGEGNGNPLQYSCLESPTDGVAWRATAMGPQSRTGPSDFKN